MEQRITVSGSDNPSIGPGTKPLTTMRTQEWSQSWHNAQLDLRLLHAFYIHHAYARHTHDYYAICVIEQGYQSFTHQGSKHDTPPGGLILINPDEVHTGEAADGDGFHMRSFLESVRIRHAQQLIEQGQALAQVATEVGFSSQSHFTNRFKQFIGVTPGQYAQGCR